MSIASEMTRLLQAKEEIRQAIENKGVEVSDSALLDEYPALISSIPMEGGDPYYEDLFNQRTNNGTDMAGMFAHTSGELDLRRLDVSNVTNMEYMFDNSSASVNIDGWDTSKVTDMNRMFSNFTGSIDISKLDTSKVTDASYMFYYANTDKIVLTGMSFPKCTKLDYMFSSASGTTLDLSSWDISNITNTYYMFNTAKYKRIDLTGWKTTNVTNMGSMFNTYSNPLVELIIPDWDMTKVTSSSNKNLFYNTSYIPNLKFIDLSRSNELTITEIASQLPTKTATTFGTVIVPYDTSQATYDALVAKYWAPIGAALSPAPTSINISAELDEIMPDKSTKVYLGAYEPWNADPSKVELVVSDSSIATMTDDNEVISTGVLGDIVIEARIIDTQEVIGTKTISVSETDSYPNLIKFRAASKPSTSSNIITVNGSNKKLSDLTYDKYSDIYSYDAGAPIISIKFTSYSNISELIKLNTDNITTAEDMFNSGDFTELDLSDWDTNNVTNMKSMFSYCNKLTSLDIRNFDTSNVTNIKDMFYNCNKLHTLRLDNCSIDTIYNIIASSSFPTNVIDGVTRTIYCKESETAGLTPPTNWVFSYVPEGEEPIIRPLYVPGEFRDRTDIFVANTMVDESHTDLSNMFYNCTKLITVTTSNWDTSNVTNMREMFYRCNSLTSLDLSKWDTSQVTDMSNMFYYCNKLIQLDVSDFDTSKVTNMTHMFYQCNKLTSLDVSKFNTSNVTSMISMFSSCENLTTIGDISNWDTSKVTNMQHMFLDCYSLTSLDLSNWDTSQVTNMLGMFFDCNSLTTLDLSNFDIVSVESSRLYSTFYNCTSLHTLRLDNCSKATIRRIITSDGFPTNAIEGVTRTIYCKEENAAGLTPPTNWVFEFIPEEDIPLYVPGQFQIYDPESASASGYTGDPNITEVRVMVNETHDDLSEMFNGCSNLVSVNTQDWDVSNVNNMTNMFRNCDSLTTLDVNNWDTGNVTHMDGMFNDCDNLQSLDLSNWNLGSLVSVNSMFSNCWSLTELNLSNWDLSSVYDEESGMNSMLGFCTSLRTLRLDNCSNDTIRKIINSDWFPTDNGGTIHCKEENAAGLVAPTNWVFSYVD